MIFGVAELVAYVSRFMTLYPGDLITTGTPPGVGLGMKPPRYLKAGDEMRLGIDGLGEQRQTVHAWDPELIDGYATSGDRRGRRPAGVAAAVAAAARLCHQRHRHGRRHRLIQQLTRELAGRMRRRWW